jgi:hypothetical protein
MYSLTPLKTGQAVMALGSQLVVPQAVVSSASSTFRIPSPKVSLLLLHMSFGVSHSQHFAVAGVGKVNETI